MRILNFQLAFILFATGLAYLANPNLKMTPSGPLENKDLAAGIGVGVMMLGALWLGKLFGTIGVKEENKKDS